MKSFKIAMIAAAMTGVMATASYAADAEPPVDAPVDYQAMGLYLRGDLGWSFLDWDGGKNDNAFTGGAGIGYQATDNLRGDLRVDWTGNYSVAPGADLSTTTVLGNMYFDWKNSSVITPYLGAGLGWGWASDTPTGSENGFTYALMGGASLDMTDMIALDVGYRFRDILVPGDNITDHSVLAGVRVKF